MSLLFKLIEKESIYIIFIKKFLKDILHLISAIEGCVELSMFFKVTFANFFAKKNIKNINVQMFNQR